MNLFKIFGQILIDNSKANKEIDKTTQQAEKSESKISKAFEKIGQKVTESFKSEKPKEFGESLEKLTGKMSSQQSKLDALKTKYKDLYLTHGKNSEEAKACAKEIEELSNELQKNKEKLQAAEKSADDFDKSLDNVADGSERTEGRLSGVFKKIGAAVLAAFSIGAIVTFGSQLVQLASNAETAFAKVSTLLNTASTDMTAYFDDIKSASSSTGVAFTEFSEAVYQSISASVDQEKAVAFTTDAVKLAKAGFTETTTSVDILTTTMNAYGDAAGTATEISDKLITTQNLGKTTVDELATNMGRVIPTANMYNVGLNTLCASYAEMTKNGIATAESTTYLNSMINELGASGTTAANTIQNKLGMSFAEAMQSGYSLTDILNLLQDEANATGVSLADMFGSQEAAKAAATLQRNASDLDSIIESMANSTGATEEAYEKVTNTFEARTQKLKTQFENIGITVGNAILPVLIKTTDAIEEKMPEIEAMIESFSPLLESMFDSVIPPALQLIETVFPSIVSLLTMLMPYVSQIGSTVLPIAVQLLEMLLPAVLQIIETVLPNLLQLIQPILDLLSPLLDLLQPILNVVVALIEPLVSLLIVQLQPIIELVVYLIEGILPPLTEALTWLADFIESMTPMIEDFASSSMQIWTDFYNQFRFLIDGIVLFISGALNVIMGIVNVFIAVFNGDFESAGQALMQILEGLGNMILGLIEAAFFNVIASIMNGCAGIGEFFNNWGSKISNFFSNLWNNSIETARTKIEFLKNTITNILSSAADLVGGIVERMKGFFDFEFKIPSMKMPHFNINPTGWNLSKLLEGQIPKLGIEWYAKAMDDGMIMNRPTVFGINGNRLMAGGEAGSETVVGTQSLMEMIQTAVDSRLEGYLSRVIDLLIQIVNLIQSGNGDIILPVYIGTEMIDERIIRASELQALRTGGR